MQRSRKLRWTAERGSILYRYRRRRILLGSLFAAGVVASVLVFLFVELDPLDPEEVRSRIDAAAEHGARRGPATIRGTVDRAVHPDATLVVVRDATYQAPGSELSVTERMTRRLEDFAASPSGAIASDGRFRVGDVPSGPVTIELWQSIGAAEPLAIRKIELARGEESQQDFP